MRILLLVFICSPFFLFAKSSSRPDSLWRVWKNPTAPDSARLRAIDQLIRDHYMLSKPDSALLLCDLQYTLAEKTKNEKTRSDVIHTRARLATYRGNILLALQLYDGCLAIKERIKDEEGIAGCMNNMGKIYLEQGLNDKAITCFFSSLRIREKRKDRKGTINVLGNIGNVYSIQGNYPMAFSYLFRSLNLCMEYKDKRGEGMGYISIGMAYYTSGQLETAKYYFWKSFDPLKQIKDRVNLGKALYNLGEVNNEMKKLDSAAHYFQRSLDMRILIHDTAGIARSYTGLGKVALNRGKTRQAIAWGEKALEMLEKNGLLRERKTLYGLLCSSYQNAGDYRRAFDAYKMFKQFDDSLVNNKVKNELFRRQLKYDFEKKELAGEAAHNRVLARLSLAREQDNSRGNAWMQLFAAISILLLVIGYFMYNRFRQRKIIADQKANLLKQKLLVSQLNPHFIFNSLNAVQQYIFSQNSLEAGTYLARLSSLMRMILDFSREDFIPVSSEVQFLTEYLDLQQMRFAQAFRYTITIDPSIDPGELHIPPMLVQPFIENAIEHGISRETANGQIHIRLHMKKTQLWYEVEDNGIGLEAAGKKQNETPHRSLATQITRERLHALNKDGMTYTISVTDKTAAAGSGVLVRISIPYSK